MSTLSLSGYTLTGHLVQVPKFLQERWAEQTQAGVHLATMRVYNTSVQLRPVHGTRQASRYTH